MRYVIFLLLASFVYFGLLLAFVPRVHAEVTDSSPHGFTSEHTLLLQATPARAYEALTRDVHLWWDASHSFSGSAAGFTMDARAGGCFCEELPGGGSVQHLTVVNAQPAKSLTLHGGLGPLQSAGVSGAMTFTFNPHDQGTALAYRYVVGGYVGGGLEVWAEPVDRVQLGQLQRLQAYLATGKSLN